MKNALTVHGEETRQFGEWLCAFVQQNPECRGCRVWFDHGNRQTHRSQVACIRGLIGQHEGRLGHIVDVDVIITTADNKIVLVIEIEERAVSPKKILGDVMASLLCSRFSVKTCYGAQSLSIRENTALFVAGFVPVKGVRLRRIEEVLQARIVEMPVSLGCISPRNVKLICTENIDNTGAALRREVGRLLTKDICR